MTINVGDLVECKKRPQKKMGIVVKKNDANSGAMSEHMKNILLGCPSVYYVYFSDEGCDGPFYNFDLLLKQSCQMTNSNIEE